MRPLHDRGRRWRRLGLACAAGSLCLSLAQAPVQAQDYQSLASTAPSDPPPANTVRPESVAIPRRVAPYVDEMYRSALRAPLPGKIYRQGGIPAYVEPLELFRNPAGRLANFVPSGRVATKDHPFFKSFGENGRSCVTCHQPPSGMSLSLSNIRARFRLTDARDPLFAPVDGANCPDAVPAARTSGSLVGGQKGRGRGALEKAYSLLLERGLIRIFLPVPTGVPDGFTVAIAPADDKPGCNRFPFNTDRPDDPAAGKQLVSMYRRPLISANLGFKVARDDGTRPSSVMWDGRELDLSTQAVAATLGHAQAKVEKLPTPEEVAEIVRFETNFFSAQLVDEVAGRLDADGAEGGSVRLSGQMPVPSVGLPPPDPFDEYAAWSDEPGTSAKSARRRSIARGQEIFNRRVFLIANVPGINPSPAPPINVTCAFCHGQPHAGNNLPPTIPGLPRFASQVDIGTGGQAFRVGGPPPSRDLPIFTVTCTGAPHPVYGRTIRTNDLGAAMVTGKCADVGSKTAPQLRALAVRAPYFSDGSAPRLRDVVDFYDRRFGIGFTKREKRDLVNFMGAL